jgi:hypothetical protein
MGSQRGSGLGDALPARSVLPLTKEASMWPDHPSAPAGTDATASGAGGPYRPPLALPSATARPGGAENAGTRPLPVGITGRFSHAELRALGVLAGQRRHPRSALACEAGAAQLDRMAQESDR